MKKNFLVVLVVGAMVLVTGCCAKSKCAMKKSADCPMKKEAMAVPAEAPAEAAAPAEAVVEAVVPAEAAAPAVEMKY